MTEPTKKYPHNVLEGFGHGCLLDLRVRLALNFLQYSPRYASVSRVESDEYGVGMIDPKMAAEDALELASHLLALAEERGLIDPLPDDDGLNRQVRLQAARTARYQILQQIEGGKMAQEEGNRVQAPMTPGGAPFLPRH